MTMKGVLLVPAPCVEEGKLQPYLPYGLLSLQAVGHQIGEPVDVLPLPGNLGSESFTHSEELAEALAGLAEWQDYQAVGLSTMASSFHHTLNLARVIKRRAPETRIWLGGPQASVHPRRLLEALPWIDAVFVGEAEESFRDFLARGAGSPAAEQDLPGVLTRGEPTVSGRPPIRDLDSLPFVDRAPGFKQAVGAAAGRYVKGAVALEAERGCPGRCTFCSTRLFWGSRPRRKSDFRLAEEMRRVGNEVGAARFAFIGDNFASPRAKLLGFCSTMARQAPEASWYASLKLDQLLRADLDLLGRGGCFGFFAGIESASQTTLQRIGKHIDLRRALEFVFAAIDLGFVVDVSFIIGFPWETEDDVSRTVTLHRDLLKRGASRSIVSVVSPLPGTDLEREYGPNIQPLRGFSVASSDGLRYGSETMEMIERIPESFTQLGYLPGVVSRSRLSTAMLSANLMSSYYQGRKPAA